MRLPWIYFSFLLCTTLMASVSLYAPLAESAEIEAWGRTIFLKEIPSSPKEQFLWQDLTELQREEFLARTEGILRTAARLILSPPVRLTFQGGDQFADLSSRLIQNFKKSLPRLYPPTSPGHPHNSALDAIHGLEQYLWEHSPALANADLKAVAFYASAGGGAIWRKFGIYSTLSLGVQISEILHPDHTKSRKFQLVFMFEQAKEAFPLVAQVSAGAKVLLIHGNSARLEEARNGESLSLPGPFYGTTTGNEVGVGLSFSPFSILDIPVLSQLQWHGLTPDFFYSNSNRMWIRPLLNLRWGGPCREPLQSDEDAALP